MAKIPEYNFDPSGARLSLDANSFAALETAGRRIGPLYNEAGQNYREIGKLRDEQYRAADFPLDFEAFNRGERGGSGGGEGGVRVSGDINNFFKGGGGSGAAGGGLRGAGRSRSAGGGGDVATPGHTAAELITNWAGNTPSFGGGGPTYIHGDQVDRAPSLISGSPLAPLDKHLKEPVGPHVGDTGYQPYASKDTSLPPQGYLQDQADRYGVAPPMPLDPPPGYSSAPNGSDTGSWWGNLWGEVSGAVSSVGAAAASGGAAAVDSGVGGLE